MDEGEERLRDTLGEIERLIAAARAKDLEVQPWIDQLAVELRSSLPDPAEAGAPLARRMRSNPRKSLGAQAHIAASALNALRG
jgi:hypothetical protein